MPHICNDIFEIYAPSVYIRDVGGNAARQFSLLTGDTFEIKICIIKDFGTMNDSKSQANLKQAVPFFMVTNIERSIEYYVKGLGFELKIDWRPKGRIEWCWLERGGVVLMLQEYHKEWLPKEKLGQGVSICFICEDALELYNEFLQKGLKPTEPFVGNKMWVSSLKDPDGYNLDFESYTDVAEETKYSDWTSQNKDQN